MEYKRLKIGKKGIKYLCEIFDRHWHISNPTPLEISGLGKIIATSMALQRVDDGELEEYFTFKQHSKSKSEGEIMRRGKAYFIRKGPPTF